MQVSRLVQCARQSGCKPMQYLQPLFSDASIFIALVGGFAVAGLLAFLSLVVMWIEIASE